MRKRIHEILDTAEPGHGDRISRAFDLGLIVLISLNVVSIILESVESLFTEYWHLFFWFEAFSVAIFSVEYLLRVWSCVERPDGNYPDTWTGRLHFMLTPMAVIDLLAIVPFYLGMFFTLDLRFLRALRLLRIFKLTRYSTAMTLLLKVLRDEAQSFGAAFFILLVIMILASSGIYLFEHQAQPQAFGNIPKSIWWSVSTLTTVGYGDVTPVTIGGKAFGILVMIVGIGMVALPAGILASAFTEQMRLRRLEFEELAESALEDGYLSPEEQQEISAARERLGLNEEDARKILDYLTRDAASNRCCPHCGKDLTG